uniref:LPS-assembly protein LptD n=1 Tax=uncultured Thiotrichaceae bacterium TaxID=298394 RepID=A0A6S6UB31_9GAMM|nr:MAG: Outer membrane protein Imp, required for envelope biogenesis / Organic solvent tolerance protein precursor [uncultured Thiotrichaceae bacterium]
MRCYAFLQLIQTGYTMLSTQHAGSGLLLLGLSASPQVALAAQNWSCPEAPVTHKNTEKKSYPIPKGLPEKAVYIEADQALFKDEGQSILDGAVIIIKDSTQLKADLATYEQQTQQVSAEGNVYFISDGLELNTEKLNFNLATSTGEMQQADYQFSSTDGRGSSQKIRREANGVARLTEASYTTCPLDNNTWSLHAKSIKLDQESETGTARNLSLRIKDTPILYLPYFSFPLSDKRKSGFLTPSLATNVKSGVHVSIPYYWNMAPNYDLTLTTNFLSQRGVKLNSDFRYLSNKQNGAFQYDFLPGDNEYNNKNRYFFNLDYTRKLSENSELTLDAKGVSDNQYFEDLGTSLESSSIVNLERTFSYITRRDDWSFSALLQDFQILDSDNEAYARLPQLKLDWNPAKTENGIEWAFNSEYTFFSNSSSDDGHRLTAEASAKKRYGNEFAYITPAVKLQHASYQLDQDNDRQVNRTLPTVSLDSGLFYERELKDGKLIQTLEPRIHYTYTPFKEQSGTPVFDSSGKTLSYSQLFSDNRFTGKDRVEDANRLSTSLTTRFQNQRTGREVFRASVGQLYHFNDRKVFLPGETIETGTRSELVFEAAGELNASTRMTATAFVDTDETNISASQIKINYKDKKERILNLGYNQRQADYEAAHISFATPVTKSWKLAGSYEHDLKNDRMLESVIGIEYTDCCWKGRIAGRKYLLSDNTSYDDAIFVEIELKGLSSFGSSARKFLSNQIYGYE